MPATEPRNVMVVGGGVGGMKAAVVAAERGHRVTIYEASKRVWRTGAARRTAARTRRVRWSDHQPGQRGRALRHQDRSPASRSTPPSSSEQAPDVVIVATGATPHRPELELMDDPVVLDAWDVINGADVPTGRIVVADWRCDWIGLGVAQLLAEQGRKVTLAVDGYMAGQRIQQYVRDEMTEQMRYAPALRSCTLVRPYGADADTVYLQHVAHWRTCHRRRRCRAGAFARTRPRDRAAGLAGRLPRRGARHRRLPGTPHCRGSCPGGFEGGVRPLTADSRPRVEQMPITLREIAYRRQSRNVLARRWNEDL